MVNLKKLNIIEKIKILLQISEKISNIDNIRLKMKTFLKEYEIVNEQNKRLKVGILGNFSSGKSTFINSIIGYPLMPVGDTPVTNIVSKITYGVEKKIKIIYEDGKEKKISQKEFLTQIHKVDGLKEERAKEIRIKYPSNKLVDIELIDTPGFSTADKEMDDQISQSVFEEAEVIFWLSTCDGGLRKDEIDRLKNFYKEKPVIMILNKSDNKTELDRKKILENLLSDEEVKTIIKKEDNIVFYSAKESLENNNEAVYEDLIENIKKTFIEQKECDVSIRKERKEIEQKFSGIKKVKEQINYIKEFKIKSKNFKSEKVFELKDNSWLKSYESIEKLLKKIKQNKELYEKEKLKRDFETYLKREFKTTIEEVKNKLEKNKKIVEVKREELLRYYKKLNKYYDGNFFGEYNAEFKEVIIENIISQTEEDKYIDFNNIKELWDSFIEKIKKEITSIDFKSFLENVIYNKKFLKEDKQLNKDIEIYSNYTIDFIKDNIDFIENNIDIIYYDYKELKELLDNFIPQQSFLKRILTIIQLYYSSKKDKILLILEENEKSILEQLNNLKLLEDSSRNLSLKKNN